MDNRYFKRDISWLSFNYRVLLEAEDETLPLYERINFISIYSSNLEEFYKIRVADHKAIATGASQSDEETMQSAAELVDEINQEVNRQLEERIRIYEQKILPALRKHHIIFYQSRNVEPFHRDFVRSFFREEIFPYLAPVPVSKDKVISFLRDNRLYLAVRLHLKGAPASSPNRIQYFVMKLPYSKVPRFILLPKVGKDYYLMFIEDIIKANLDTIFPGYEVDRDVYKRQVFVYPADVNRAVGGFYLFLQHCTVTGFFLHQAADGGNTTSLRWRHTKRRHSNFSSSGADNSQRNLSCDC